MGEIAMYTVQIVASGKLYGNMLNFKIFLSYAKYIHIYHFFKKCLFTKCTIML